MGREQDVAPRTLGGTCSHLVARFGLGFERADKSCLFRVVPRTGLRTKLCVAVGVMLGRLKEEAFLELAEPEISYASHP